MSENTARLYLKTFGVVIPDTAIGLVMFNTWNETSYELSREVRVANPTVLTKNTTYVAATIQIIDPNVIKLIADEDDDEDNEDEEEEEAPKRRRGRPAKKEEVVEAVEPVELEGVFWQHSSIVESAPLSDSTPIINKMEQSDKNERVIRRNLVELSAYITQLEEIRENIGNDLTKVNEELSASVEDMLGEGARTANIQSSAVEEYRNKQRRKENNVITAIDESLDKFAGILERMAEESEPERLNGDIVVGDSTFSAAELVATFFKKELVSLT